MKRITYIVLFILAAVAASCDMNIDSQEIKNAADSTAVGFNVYVNRGVSTKAGWAGDLTTATLESTASGGFGVFAYYGNGALYNETSKPDFMYDQQVTYTSNNVWEYTPIKYWPNEFGAAASSEAADRLTFFAYAPFADVTPSTGIVTGDATSGIIGMSRNITAGDPVVMYSSSLTPGAGVDLCWGVAAEPFTSSVDGDNNNVAKGYPFIDVVKTKTGDHLKFEFNHALAQLNVQVDAEINTERPDDGKTKIYVRSVTFNGFSMRGSLNLNSNIFDGPVWYDISGTGKLKRDPVTVYDGRTDGMEGIATAMDVSEKPANLNPVIVQSKPYGDQEQTAGVTATAVNLFNNTDENAPVMVIPTPGVPMSVTIVYDVETEDIRLAGYLSDGVTHGSSVENKITKTITLANDTPMSLAWGKRYIVKLHLGLTSVKFQAEVADWDNTPYEGTGYLPENTTSLGTATITYPTSTDTLTSLTMWKGETMATPPTVTVKDENDNPVTGFDVEWTSSNTSVATVVADGTVTPVAPGTTTITVKAKKEGKTSLKSYTLYINELTGISITSTARNIAIDGGMLPVKATLVINGGNAVNGNITASVVWESSEPGKISVTSPVNAVKEGDVYVATTTATTTTAVLGNQADITASFRGFSDRVTLTCTDSRTVTGVTLGASTTTVWRYDGYTVPSVTVQSSEGDITSIAEITWELDNSSVTLTGGKISLATAGEHTVKVTASYNNTEASATVTVYANEVTGISISPSPAFVAPDRTLSLTATLSKTNHGEVGSLTNPSISWVSASTDYVTINPATGVATGVALGDSQVTATVDSHYMQSGSSNTATCLVTCTNSTSATGNGYTGWN